LKRGAVYRTVAKNGGQKELEELQNRFRSAERAEERQMLLYAIVTIGDYHLMQQVLGGFLPGFRIRIHLIRIRIQHFRLNTDPDTLEPLMCRA
jgi:hypothetical protein